mmetsp:Transcript_99657/g.177413  ORF Transcript_99657/g.177413 Transcript_99657/m.177413 type:complete len:161 (+) Transcript_99657:3-485(+)
MPMWEKPYRLPSSGEEVILTGMKSRPHLNGVAGEVVKQADDEGFLTIRLGEVDGTSDHKWKIMKVRPHRLEPLAEHRLIDPSLHIPASDDRASCKTTSSPRSAAMSGSSRWSSSYATRTSKTSQRSAGSGSVATLQSHWHKQHLNVGGFDGHKMPTAVIL